MHWQPTRRRVLGTFAASTVAIAGCSGDGDDGNTSPTGEADDGGPDSSGSDDDGDDSSDRQDNETDTTGEQDGETDGSGDGEDDEAESSMPPPEERTFDGWIQQGYDARNSGQAPDELAPTSSISVQWEYEGNNLMNTPVVANETVVVGDRDSDGTIYGVDATTGEEQWTVGTEDFVANSPVVLAETVYVWTDFLRALDLHDGTEQWRQKIGERGFTSSPTLYGETLYFGNADSNLYAIDPADGSTLWNYTSTDSVYTTPAVAGGTVYAGTSDATVFAVDAGDGSELWSKSIAGKELASSPAIADGVLYFGDTEGTLSAVNASDGTQEWTVDIGSAIFTSPAVANGAVYFAGEDGLYARDAATGAEQWTVGSEQFGNPVVVDGTVVAGSNAPRVSAFDPASGDELWQFEPGRNASTEPAVVDGTVFIGCDDDRLYALTE